MPNYLKMPKKAQVLALLELGWSYRRIEAETGVRRETVSRYDEARQANAAKTFPGSDPSPLPDSLDIPLDTGSNAAKTFAGSESNPAKTFPGSPRRPRFAAAVYRTAITEKLDAGLSLQRIWQDLVEDYGYGASYESVKRFVRTIAPTRRAVGVFHCAPGQEGQVDFFRGAPTLDAATGEWRRPWVFRMTLGHSRHGYEEAVWDRKLETFLRLHEHAFRDLGGVPTVVRRNPAGRKPGTPNKLTAEVKAIAREFTAEAIRKLVRIMRNPKAPEAAIVSACREILDRGWGRPAQALTGIDETPLMPRQIIHEFHTGPPPSQSH